MAPTLSSHPFVNGPRLRKLCLKSACQKIRGYWEMTLEWPLFSTLRFCQSEKCHQILRQVYSWFFTSIFETARSTVSAASKLSMSTFAE
jgi:hypothetical protein